MCPTDPEALSAYSRYMLCWICPECGRDCSPAVRECPACAQQQQVQSHAQSNLAQNVTQNVTQGVLSMAESLRAVPSLPLLEPASQQYLLFGLTNGHSSVSSHSAVMLEEDPAVPAGETIDGLVRPLVESAKAPSPKFTELRVPDEPPASPAIVELASPPAAAQPPVAAPSNGARPNPFLARVAQIAELRIPLRAPLAPASPVKSASLPAAEPPAALAPVKAEPVTPRVPQVKFVELAVSQIPPLKTAPRVESEKLAPARPGQNAPCMALPTTFRTRTVRIIGHPATSAKRSPSVASLVPLAGPSSQPIAFSKLRIAESGPFAAAKPQSPELKVAAEPFCAAAGFVEQAGVLSEALQLQAESLLDEIKSGIDAVETKIQAIVATFQTQPKLALLAAPSAIVTAPAPPDLQWMKMPRPKFAAHKPTDRKCDRAIAPPQKLPLAGPCLTPELQNYIEAPAVERARAKNGIGLPAWIVSLVIATSLFLAIGVALQYLSTNREAKAAVVPTPAPAAPSAPVAPLFEQHPFARFIEVTGLRVVADTNHRSQVQYIVVNHSATQLSGMTIQIAVRSSVEPASSKPLFTVSAVVPSLGPHQSKEIRTDLDSELRNSAIPDWEYLRTEVHIGTQN